MKDYQPYSDYSNLELKKAITNIALKNNMPLFVIELINLAFTDKWEPNKEFDGCTVVQDYKHPDVACFIHDWLWRTGKGGYLSNKLFYELMLLEGYSKKVAKRRYIVVSLAWVFGYSLKQQKETNVSLKEVKKLLPKSMLK